MPPRGRGRAGRDLRRRSTGCDIERFFDRWQGALPSPLTAEDRARGYCYELAFRQAELSDTHVFDRPAAWRAWFERMLPDQLTLGRPDQVTIVFGRKVTSRTPGRFHTKVVHSGVEPAIQVHYRASRSSSTSKRVARSEPRRPSTTPATSASADADPGELAGAGPRRPSGQPAPPRAQLQACQCAPDATTLARVVLPSIEDGLPAPGLRFGDPRTMALLACLCCFQHLFAGLTNRTLRELIAGLIPGYSARQMTYDLRRPLLVHTAPPGQSLISKSNGAAGTLILRPFRWPLVTWIASARRVGPCAARSGGRTRGVGGLVERHVAVGDVGHEPGADLVGEPDPPGRARGGLLGGQQAGRRSSGGSCAQTRRARSAARSMLTVRCWGPVVGRLGCRRVCGPRGRVPR